MIIGLCGAHRSGKTTLAREFVAENKKYAFVETSVSKMIEQTGLDAGADYPMSVRLDLQEHILAELDKQYAAVKSHAIFDRTPLDAAAYLLADVQRENVAPRHQARIAAYLQRCFDITNRRFTFLCFVPSVIPLVAAQGKAPAEIGYVEHISVLINGLKVDQRMKLRHLSLPRTSTEIESRVRGLTNGARRIKMHFEEEFEAEFADGAMVH